MSRGMVLGALVAVGAVTAVSAAYQAQQPNAPKVVQAEKLKDNLYMLKGGGGNTAVFVGTIGVVVVDTKNPGWGQPILDKIKELTDKPVTTIINTHTHADHTGGNSEFPRTVEFVAHENTRTNMARMDEFKGQKAAFLPSRTFKDSMSLLAGTDRIDLRYFGAGHTNGDAVIVFPSLRTVVMGDLFARKWAPLVDSENGGSATAFPQTLASAVRSIKDVDTVITGHATTTLGSGAGVSFVRSNPVMTWADLEEYAGFMRDFVAAAQAAQKAGRTAADAAKSLNLPAKYKNYNMARAAEDVQKVYDESKR